MKENIIVLGAGMAGFGAAYFLRTQGIHAKIYERNNYHGGNATSFNTNGFIFDSGPHISFTKKEKIQQLFAESVKNKYQTFDVAVNNLWKGHWIKHPAQVNLHGLPEDLVVEIISEFIEKIGREKPEINSFKDWLYASFGKTFAENFPMKYGHKFHTTTADNMSTDWVGPRLYQPDIKEILHGALSPKTKDVHYVSHFRYPDNGGYISFLEDFKNDSEIVFNHEVTELNTDEKQVRFKNGVEINYEGIVSSIPLPDLIELMPSAPIKVKNAAAKLACSTCVIVNLGINRNDISDAHWSYFYDDDIVFTRLSFPHMQSPGNVPDQCGSIQAEIYFSKKYRPLTQKPEEFIEDTIKDLNRCGLLKDDDEILFKEARLIEYANIIFDHDRSENLKIVHEYLDQTGVHYCGRYGEWGYQWTDESFVSGEDAAKKMISNINK